MLDEVRRALPIAAFHIRNHFRPKYFDGRAEGHVGGRVAVYDTFAAKEGTEVVLVGHYGHLPLSSAMHCLFASGVVVEGRIVNDTPHDMEGEQVLIALFAVPNADRLAGRTEVTITAGRTLVVVRRPIDLSARAPRRYLTVATLMKDEGRFLREWIEYYRLLGADHFLIYDNRSLYRTQIRRLLRPYIESGWVTLLDWDYPYRSGAPDNSWRYCQRGQMHHALYKYGDHSSWMLFVDVDEFVFPLDLAQSSLLPLLQAYDADPSVAALQFKMIWFGDSGHRETPPGLVIENYVHRDREVLPLGREKCVVKPALTKLMFIHATKELAAGSRLLPVSPEHFRINHYFATSAKRANARRPELNAVPDRGMLRFAKQLRRID